MYKNKIVSDYKINNWNRYSIILPWAAVHPKHVENDTLKNFIWKF